MSDWQNNSKDPVGLAVATFFLGMIIGVLLCSYAFHESKKSTGHDNYYTEPEEQDDPRGRY